LDSIVPNPKWQEIMDSTYEQHVREIFAPRVQLAREFEKILGKEKTHEIIKNMCERDEAQSARQTREKEHIESFQDLIVWMKKNYGSPYWPHVLTYTLEEAPQGYWFTCTECLYAKIFRDLNAADLGYIMLCNTDFAWTSACHPKLRLKRTKTLMQGDECCDFNFYWEE